MCTLAVYLGVSARRPLVVAANRDEALARPAAAPALLRSAVPRSFGGRDLTAGGTWLAVGETGLVAGLLNRQSGGPPDPGCRSRGLLCLEVMVSRTAAEAAERVAGEPAGRYNPFNLLLADPREAFVAVQAAGAAPRLARLAPGLHLLTNLDVDDATCPRIAASHQRFAEAGTVLDAGTDDHVAARLGGILADHRTPLDPRGPGSLCVHGRGYGTRASTVVLVPPTGRPAHWYHADGPPCRVSLSPLPLPF